MPVSKGKNRGKTIFLNLTSDQAADAESFGTIKKTGGGYQTVFAEISGDISTSDGKHIVKVYGDSMDKLKLWANRPETGSYQDWCRDVLTANNIDWKTGQ